MAPNPTTATTATTATEPNGLGTQRARNERIAIHVGTLLHAALDVERKRIDDGGALRVGVATESSQLGKRIEILLPVDRFFHPDDVLERRNRNQSAAGNLDDQRSRLNVGIHEDRLVRTGRGHQHINGAGIGLPLRVASEVVCVERMVRDHTEISQRFGEPAPILPVSANQHVDVARHVLEGTVQEPRNAADHDVPDVMHRKSIDDPIKIERGGLRRRHAGEVRRNSRWRSQSCLLIRRPSASVKPASSTVRPGRV